MLCCLVFGCGFGWYYGWFSLIGFFLWFLMVWCCWVVGLRETRFSEKVRKMSLILPSLFWNRQLVLKLRIFVGSQKIVSGEAWNTSLPEISNFGNDNPKKSWKLCKISAKSSKNVRLAEALFLSFESAARIHTNVKNITKEVHFANPRRLFFSGHFFEFEGDGGVRRHAAQNGQGQGRQGQGPWAPDDVQP